LVASFLTLTSPFALAQQAPIGSQTIYPAQPVVPVPRGMSPTEEDAYRRAYADYQVCLRSRAREMELSKAAENLIALPRQRAFFEGELARRPDMRQQFPGGFRDIVEQQFREYRKLGGTAASPESVVPIPPPCNPPTASRDPSRSPVTGRATKTVPSK